MLTIGTYSGNADDVNKLGGSIHTVKENKVPLVVASM